MSAELLRKAATILRERAEAATPGPWTPNAQGFSAPSDDAFIQSPYHELDIWPADSAYIATMQPGVGLALADWLTENAHRCDQLWIEPMPQAVALARLIVGEQP